MPLLQAQEYSKTVPKPKVAAKVSTPPATETVLRSARSLSKLNDVDEPQLTYRTNHSTIPAHLANHTTGPAQPPNHGSLPVELANQLSARNSYIPHSLSSPVISQKPVNDRIEPVQLNYLDTIELLHKRHLEEKRLIAGIRQKI